MKNKNYIITKHYTSFIEIEVKAKTEEEALELADEKIEEMEKENPEFINETLEENIDYVHGDDTINKD